MCVSPHDPLWLSARRAPRVSSSACGDRTTATDRPVLHDFDATQRRDVVKELSEVFLPDSPIPVSYLAALAKIRLPQGSGAPDQREIAATERLRLRPYPQ